MDPAVLGHTKDEKIAYYVLTQNHHEEAMDILTRGFYPEEPISVFLEISKSIEAVEELNLLAIDIAKDNISVAAVDTETNRVVGVCFNKIQVKTADGEPSYFQKFKKEVCRNPKAIGMIDFMVEIDAEVDIFEHFNMDRVVELNFLGVAPTHRHRGIGLGLIAHSLNLCKAQSVAPVACMIGTSTYTQRIGKRLNFQVLAELPFEKGNIRDDVFEEVTRFHDRSILLAKQL